MVLDQYKCSDIARGLEGLDLNEESPSSDDSSRYSNYWCGLPAVHSKHLPKKNMNGKYTRVYLVDT